MRTVEVGWRRIVRTLESCANRLGSVLVLVVLLASAHANGAENSPTKSTAPGPDIYARTQAQPDLLAKYLFLSDIVSNSDDPGEVNRAAQSLSFAAAAIGEYRQAQQVFPLKRRHANLSTLDLDGYLPVDAVAPIVRASEGRRVIMVNEAHHLARTRLLTLYLLQPLREAGFSHLALETLDNHDFALAQRGYAIEESGYYSNEPVFAELIREALRLGYKVVPYEHMGNEEGHQARETGQARNLARLLEKAPDARVLVHAGYAHIYRNDPSSMFGARTMVEELQRLTGLHPLTVEQTLLYGHIDPQYDRAEYTAGVKHWRARHDEQLPTRPFVLLDDERTPWSLRPTVFDISVFAVPVEPDETWRSLDGRRERQSVSDKACDRTFPCLIEARRSDELDTAVPADRKLLRRPEPATLWLADGCYRLDAINAEGTARGPEHCTATATTVTQ